MIKAVIFDWAGTTIDYGCFAPIQGFINGFRRFNVELTGPEAREPMGLLKIEHTRALANMKRVKESFHIQNNREITEEDIQSIYKEFEETLFANIKNHVDIKDYVLETVAELRSMGIKIGSTTGYTKKMMAEVVKLSKSNKYNPDFIVASDEVPQGRPSPFMIWKNLMQFSIDNPLHAVKVGDTVADILEGQNAGVWTVGVIMGSSELGLSRDEVLALSKKELNKHKERVRSVYYKAGADFIIDDMNELLEVIDGINEKLATNTPHKLLTPGPLSTKQSVKNAMLTDHCTWDNEYKRITAGVMEDITNISADENYATVLFQGSGSYAVESMINSICYKEDKILFLVNGEYGKRMLEIAKLSKKKFDVLHFDMCKPIDTKEVEKRLKKDKRIKTVVFVHCETTTGVLNPIEDITNIAKKYNKMVLVDVMSSFGAYDIDMKKLDIDAMAASSNKCLEGLPGLSFVIVKRSIVELKKSYSKSHSLDLFDQYNGLYFGGGKFRFTSPTNILLALEQAISEYQKEGGLVQRKKRYFENHETLVNGLSEIGINSIVDYKNQSYIITTFDLGKLNFEQMYKFLKEKGFIIYPGKFTEIPTFRIGNIGDVYKSDMIDLIDAIKEFLKI